MKGRSAFPWLVVTALTAPAALALDPAKLPSQYVHRAWGARDGLPSAHVRAIAQTPDGYLRLGTAEGLVRFDGVRFLVSRHRSTRELTGDQVSALHVDSAGTLWIGVTGDRGQLLTLSRRSLRSLPNALVSSYVEGIVEDATGAVWVATNEGLTRVKNGSVEKFRADTAAWGAVRVRTLCPVPGGGVIVGTRKSGLFSWRDSQVSRMTAPLPSPHVYALLADRAGSLWVGTDAGLARLALDPSGRATAERAAVLTTSDGLPHALVLSLLQDREGTLWVGTRKGLARYRDGQISRFPPSHTLASASVIALCEDREGSLWVGTQEDGLHQLRNGKVTPIGVAEGLSARITYSVGEGRDGTIWIGTKDAGLDGLAPDGRVERHLTEGKAAISDGYALSFSASGALWVGTDMAGLLRLSNGRVAATHDPSTASSGPVILSVAETRDGSVWVGTRHGVSRLAGGEWSHFGEKEGFTDTSVFAILEDRRGTVWFGTDGTGVFAWKDGVFKGYTKEDGLASNTALAVSEGGDERLWIAGAGGLSRFANGRFAALRAEDGLFCDTLYSALEDGAGKLWMSCSGGIASLSIADLDRAIEKRAEVGSSTRAAPADTLRGTLLGVADGMRVVECNGGTQPAACRTRDGRLVFASMDGIVVVDPAHLPRNRFPPLVQIEEVLGDRGVALQVPENGELVVPPGGGTLEIHYTAMGLAVPERIRFEYQLEGFDPRRVDAGPRRTAYYTNLPPRAYTFRVTARNEDGIASASGAWLSLKLQPHFWQTRLFMAVWVVPVALLVWVIYALRVRRMRSDFQLVLAERTRLAREIHDTLAQGLTAIVMRLEAAKRVIREDADEASTHLESAAQLARVSLIEARRSVWELRSAALDAHDLPAAITETARQMSAGKGVKVEVGVVGEPLHLTESLERELFRIAQEAIHNALKYSDARSIGVEVGQRSRRVFVRIRDDGRGFDPRNAVSKTGGFGLLGMRERAERLGGSLTVESEPGKGTTIAAELPMA